MHIMVLNDEETFTDLHGCKIVNILRDGANEDEEFDIEDLDNWDEIVAEYEKACDGEIWHDCESELIGEVITKFA